MINSDCDEPLVCTFGRCHKQCDSDRDCPGDQRCVKGQEGGVCQLVEETRCETIADCVGDQRCGADGRCRDGCSKDDDCLTEQTCAKGGQCASIVKDNLDAEGNLIVPGADGSVSPATGGRPGSGGAGGATTEVDASAGGLPGAGGDSTGGASTGGASTGGASTGGTSSGGASTGGAATGGMSSGGGGMDAGPSCGHPSEACCSSGAACGTGLQCAGEACTCLVGFGMQRFNTAQATVGHVLRSDGSAWYFSSNTDTGEAVRDAGGALVTGFTKVATALAHSCGIKGDGSVYCWWNSTTSPGQTTTNGELGDGTNVRSHAPVRVLTSPGGTALASAVDITADGSTSCAVVSPTGAAAENRVFCWGTGATGLLGDGTKPAARGYAEPVLVAASGSPFTGAVQVEIAAGDGAHACLRRFDGSVWCWGNDAYGQLGDGTNGEKLVPVGVTSLAASATQIALTSGSSCARTGNTVWCWGFNADGRLGNGTTAPSSTPVQVRATVGGAPFDGVDDVQGNDGTVCATKGANRALWCWGRAFSSVPTAARISGTPVEDVFIWDVSHIGTAFVSIDGQLTYERMNLTNRVPCL